jgi:hypothetical protein
MFDPDNLVNDDVSQACQSVHGEPGHHHHEHLAGPI